MVKITKYVLLLFAVNYQLSFSQCSCDLVDWVLGDYLPEVSSSRPALPGYSGECIHVPVGTSPFYYEVSDEGGEGSVTFWIYDPGNCLENSDAGYGARGPKWGLQNPNYDALVVGIDRANYLSGCPGYAGWCTIAPYEPWLFRDGLRAEFDTDWSPGWYQWTVSGTMDDITFSLYDVDYDSIDGAPYALVHGDAVRTYNDSTYDGRWVGMFGIGWNAFHIRGDNASGIEDVSVYVVSGTGIFSDAGGCMCYYPVSRAYNNTSWGDIKKLFRE